MQKNFWVNSARDFRWDEILENETTDGAPNYKPGLALILCTKWNSEVTILEKNQ